MLRRHSKDNAMKFKKAKIIAVTACSVIGAILLATVGYLLYVLVSYYRVEDRLELQISGNAEEAVPVGEKLTLITYNIGFGAYSDDYSFFMDGGEYSRGLSKEAVEENTKGSLETVLGENPDFILFQEVDRKGDRSYRIDQSELLEKGFPGYDSVFAQNYDSPYFLYPFNQPIGANLSGMMTFSRFGIESSVRRQLPIEESLYKLIDLDRCYTVSVIPTSSGKSLVIYNVHLSAYTSDGTIADEQLRMLSSDMENEYGKGNYVIAAGDFNKDLLGDSSKYFKREGDGEFTWAKPIDTSILPKDFLCRSGENAPTCRNADSAFRGDGTDFVLSVDGIIVSPNVELVFCETVDNSFKYSDHNPVKAEFILK